MEKHLTEKIRKELLEMQDLPYRDFHAKLMPTVDKEICQNTGKGRGHQQLF